MNPSNPRPLGLQPCDLRPWDLRLEILEAGAEPRISLAGWCGVGLEMPLSDLLIAAGKAARVLELGGPGTVHLKAPQWHQVLRQCRHLLQPGGTLRVPDTAISDQTPPGDLEQTAWLCGFTAAAVRIDGKIELSVPQPISPDAGSPQVSLIIPAYKSRFFAETLKSAMEQTHPDYEILICDDSPDGAIGEIVGEQKAAAAGKIRYIRNPENLGGRCNYLQGFAEARGKYIKFLNDDDLLHPDCLARMSACLDAFPAVTLVTSYRQLIDADGCSLPDLVFNQPVVTQDSLLDGRSLATRILANQVNVVGEPSTVMFRKGDVLDNRPHLMSYAGQAARKNGDLAIWTTLMSRGEVIYLSDPLSKFRQHDHQVQRSPAFRTEAVQAWQELQAAAIATGLVYPACLNRCRPVALVMPGSSAGLVISAEDHFLAENLDAAAGLLGSALNLEPDNARARNDLSAVYWHAGLPGAALLESLLGFCSAEPSETAILNLQDMLTVTGHEAQAQALMATLAAARSEPALV